MFNFSQTPNPITSMDCSPTRQQPSFNSFSTVNQQPVNQQPVYQQPVYQTPLTIPTINKAPCLSEHPAKKIKQNVDSGVNIVNKIDYNKVGIEFVQFYYKNINTIQPIVPYLRQSTIFKFNSEEHAYSKLPTLFDQLKKYTYNIEKVEVLPSGSRRLDIMVSGNITGSGKFSQYFLLCNEKEQQWYIKSSILV